MSHIRYWLFQGARGIILFCSLFYLLLSTYLLLAISFNLPTVFKTGPRSYWTVGEHDRGMPVKANFWVKIPDSIAYLKYTNGSGYHYWNPGPHQSPVTDDRKPIRTDMIRVKYHQNEAFDKSVQPLSIATVELKEATVFIRPKNVAQKFLFGLPSILRMMMVGLILFQVFQLLTVIYQKTFFEKRNYRRLASIGWLMIGYNIIVYILESLQNNKTWVNVDFESTIPDFHMPVQMSGNLQSSVDFPMLLFGGIVLAFAGAFRIGYRLQKDQELTV